LIKPTLYIKREFIYQICHSSC